MIKGKEIYVQLWTEIQQSLLFQLLKKYRP